MNYTGNVWNFTYAGSIKARIKNLELKLKQSILVTLFAWFSKKN